MQLRSLRQSTLASYTQEKENIHYANHVLPTVSQIPLNRSSAATGKWVFISPFPRSVSKRFHCGTHTTRHQSKKPAAEPPMGPAKHWQKSMSVSIVPNLHLGQQFPSLTPAAGHHFGAILHQLPDKKWEPVSGERHTMEAREAYSQGAPFVSRTQVIRPL